MRTLLIISISSYIICFVAQAQTSVQMLENVPNEFIERYQQEYHEYNPLHIGNIWQFMSYLGTYAQVEIDMDTTINSIKYYRKLDMFFSYDSTYFYLERNDSSKATTYRLDIEDLDEDGDSLDEILLDSLEVPHATNYFSYRYTWRSGDSDPKPVVIQGPYWVIVFGDTVKARIASYLFQDDLIADKYGVVEIYPEGSPPVFLTGMIINGVKYGNIVKFEDLNYKFLSEFKLENNYPNPFNPTTKIKFTIPFVETMHASSLQMVTLKVYDILGNEVATLVNEEKPAGEYEVIFDASSGIRILVSGIYFYQLRADNFAQTKKMVYLK